MNPHQSLRTRWRSLERRARRWIIAGLVAGFGLVSAAVTSVVSDQVKGFVKETFDAVTSLGKGYSCQWRAGSHPVNPHQPVVLLPRLEDDPKDELWRTIIKILYDETEFDTVPNCERFASTQTIDINTARGQFLHRMEPHIASAHADMLLFGTVYATGKIKVWSANRLGGCDWQKSSPIDLTASGAQEQVFAATRSALLRAVAEGLTAACERDANNDWSDVARLFDVISAYVEKRKSLLTPDDHDDILIHLFALSNTHYQQVGDEQWFERAVRAAQSLIKERQANNNENRPVSITQGHLALLYFAKFKKTESSTALQQAISNLRLTRQTSPWAWDEILVNNGDDAAGAFDAGLRANIGGVTREELDRTRTERSDKQLEKFNADITANPNDAEAYYSRGWTYASMGDYTHAIADYADALRLDPNHRNASASRGYATFYTGNFGQAETDLARAVQLTPEDAYPALWLYFVLSRTGNKDAGPGPLQTNAEKLKQKGWPFPVVEMILGSRTAEQMFASAKTMNQRCEAEFYLGEWQLKNGGPEKAAEHFKSVLRICPLDFIEHKGAVAELNRLTQ